MRIALLLSALLLVGCGSRSSSPAEPAEPARKGKMTVTETVVEVVDRLEFAIDSAEVTEPDRLTAKGYGADKPVTVEGVDPAVANRTVVLLILERDD